MKVYIVLCSGDYGTVIKMVFDSKVVAEHYCENIPKDCYTYRVEEWDVQSIKPLAE
jgi:hypothetical protein